MQQQWLPHELEEIWSLSSEEQGLLLGLSDVNRLGFSVCLKFFQNEGYFPVNRAEVPQAIVEYLAELLGLSPALFNTYTLTWPLQ